MNPINKDSNEVYGRERSATFGVQNEKYEKADFSGFSLNNVATNQNQILNYEQYLSKYEFLRLNYENEGISQQSLLLLRRLSNSFHIEDPTLSNLPILKSMITVCK